MIGVKVKLIPNTVGLLPDNICGNKYWTNFALFASCIKPLNNTFVYIKGCLGSMKQCLAIPRNNFRESM